MVPSPPRDVTRLSSSTPISEGPDSEPHQSGIHNVAGNPSTGRMACLRNPLLHEEFLHKLQTCSCHHGETKPTPTTTHYLQNGRIAWCEQRGRDPTVGPVGDVVNLLAELFTEGQVLQCIPISYLINPPEGRWAEHETTPFSLPTTKRGF